MFQSIGFTSVQKIWHSERKTVICHWRMWRFRTRIIPWRNIPLYLVFLQIFECDMYLVNLFCWDFFLFSFSNSTDIYFYLLKNNKTQHQQRIWQKTLFLLDRWRQWTWWEFLSFFFYSSSLLDKLFVIFELVWFHSIFHGTCFFYLFTYWWTFFSLLVLNQFNVSVCKLDVEFRRIIIVLSFTSFSKSKTCLF